MARVIPDEIGNDLMCDNCATRFRGGRFDYDTNTHHCNTCRNLTYYDANVTMTIQCRLGALDARDALLFVTRAINKYDEMAIVPLHATIAIDDALYEYKDASAINNAIVDPIARAITEKNAK